MDVEEEEAPPNKSPSPPLQQPSDYDSPPHLSPNPLECDTDLPNFSNAGALEAVIAEESTGATTGTDNKDESAVLDDVAAAEGGEMQVMEAEIVVEVSGNEGTDVDLEAAKVEEEEANLIIGEELELEVEVRDEKSIASNLMVEEEEEDVGEQQQEEVEHEQQQEQEEDHNLMGKEDDVGEQQQEEEQDHNFMGEEEDVGEQHQEEEEEHKQEQEEEEHEQQQEQEEKDHNLMGEDEEDIGEQQQEEVEEEQEQEEHEQEQEEEQEQQLEQEEEEDEEQERGDDDEEEEEEGEEQERGEEEEEEEEDEQGEDEEPGADGDIGLAENREAGEEMEVEVAEEQSGSVSGGKRKRGSGVKNSKSSGRVPSKKKMEEDVCFICFDGGDLVLCDRRGCPKAYHPSCINRDEAFFRAKGKWNCGWHLCSNCQKNAFYMCHTCTFSLCKGCIKDAVILCVRGNKGFCETCMRTVMLIEQNEQGNNTGQVDFDDKNSWEYLFKDYYLDLKGKLSLTFDELRQAKNPWKGSEVPPSKEESPDELFDASNDKGSGSDSSYENVDLSRSKKRKAKKRAKSRSKEGNSRSAVTRLGADGPSADESFEWASKELLEFVMHMRNGEKSILSQFDVQALLLEYIKRNKLRDPRRKSQIICDARLQSLFGKPRVGHFEMLKLLESHFLLKEDSQAEDLQGSVVDTEVSHLEGDGNADTYLKGGKDKKRKNRKKGDERGLQSNIDDYAAIDNHNINLIYLKRNLVEDLLEDTEKFHDIVVGSFVRIRISGSGQKQDLYRLVQVVGTCKATEPYKVGKRVTEIMLEILNLNKTEIVSIDIISNQEFTEDECKRLRQSIKCGLINRLTVGDIQDKALALQAVRVKDWLETEIVRLSHLRDRASEKGRKKELRECVEKLQLLKTPEERQRRLEEIPEIHVDPNMDPSYESDEGDAMEDKRQENYMRPRGSTGFGRRGREIVSPRSGSISSDSWSGTRSYSHVNQELSKSLSNKGFSVEVDDVSNGSELLNDAQLHQGRDRESQLSNSRERQKLLSSSFESNAKNTQPLVTSDSFSTAVKAASAAPSSAGIALPAVQINESEKMWHYQDPSAKVQGPFSIVQLRKWNNTGYFPADLRIWKATERQDESILLTDALAGKFSKEPSLVDKTPPRAQTVHDLQYSSSYSRKSPLAAQGIEGQVGGRPTLDQKSGSWNSHSTLGSPGQSTGGNWRSKDNMNSLASKTSPLAVEVPKNPGNGWGSDASGVRNESANLPSPTPQTNSGGTKGQAFENKWSPTPVQLTGSHLGNSFPGGPGGLQASVAVRTENVVHNTENVSTSQPSMASASTDARQLHPQATAVAQVLATGVDIKTAAANMQNQVANSHNYRAEAQGWATAGVSNNAAAMPVQQASHGLWGDASSVQNPTLFTTGNPTGSLPMHGFPGMIAPASSNQSNVTAPAQPNINWGMGMPGNQNVNWNGALPANMNVNWMMPAQVPAPGNANPGWVAPAQGLPPVNAVGWAAPGQGHPQVNNANAGWVVPGQGLAPGSANPGWAAPAANPGMWASEQSHNGDRFPNQGDRGTHGGDSGYGGKSWNRQSSFGSGGRGGSSRPPVGGQRGICRFHESGRCRKGASCDYQHN